MSNIRLRISSFLLSVVLMGFLSSCKEDEPPLPDNEVSFSASELGFSDEDSQATITIDLTRAADEDKTLHVSFVPTGVTYGVEFTTTPAAVSNAFTLTIPAGSTEASFTVNKAEDIFLEGDESILFTIESADEPFVLSEAITLTLSFSAIVSEGGSMQLQGIIAAEPGSSAGNSVFVDFSANLQTQVARLSWDLGFYSGADFRVMLNNTSAASAVMVNKTDLTQVTEADVNVEDLAIGFASGSFSVYDSVDGALEHMAISAVSATDAENKVWVINRVGGSGAAQATTELMKIRVLRNGSGYTLQYAKGLNTTTFQTATITKNSSVNFSYFHFDNGAVTVEPAKTNWDIQWTWGIYHTPFEGQDVPYAFSDLVFVNHHNGVKVDTVFTADIAYNDFDENDLGDYDLTSYKNVIGAGWRNILESPVGVKADQFYIVQDPQGNIYKLRFINFHPNDGGTRGKPNIQYALVKKADD